MAFFLWYLSLTRHVSTYYFYFLIVYTFLYQIPFVVCIFSIEQSSVSFMDYF